MTLCCHCSMLCFDRVSAVWESERERKRRSNCDGDGDGDGENESNCEKGRGGDSKSVGVDAGVGVGVDAGVGVGVDADVGVGVGVCYRVLEILLSDSIEGLIALQTHTYGHPHPQSSPHSQSSIMKNKMWKEAYEGNVHSGAFRISDINCTVLSPRKRKDLLRQLAARNPVLGAHPVMCCITLYCTELPYPTLLTQPCNPLTSPLLSSVSGTHLESQCRS
jgi:hypothetical protein